MSESDSKTKPTVALIGTLDTKLAEYQHVATGLEERGVCVVMLDISTRPSAQQEALTLRLPGSEYVSPTQLLPSSSFDEDRQELNHALREACIELLRQRRIDGIASFGGSQNTSAATAVMRHSAFPLGLPKFCLTTMASGDISEYIGEADICVMPSVGDISGSLNAITRTVLATAIGAISGMAHEYHQRHQRSPQKASGSCKPLVAVTMFGVTTPAVHAASEVLRESGYEPVAFHATGTGGRTMERLCREGYFAGVLDLTTTEVADDLFGGVLSAGPDRLTAASATGVPQLVSVGALDMINFGSLHSLPFRLADDDQHHSETGARVWQHNDQVTLLRTTVDQNREMGNSLVERITRTTPTAPTEIVLPMRGISMLDAEGQPFEDSKAREALADSIQQALKDNQHIKVTKQDLRINDPEFAQSAANRLVDMIQAFQNDNEE